MTALTREPGTAREPIEQNRADVALAVVVEARIRELIAFRRWYRKQANWDHWMDLAAANDAELRALVRLARAARRLRVPVIDHPADATVESEYAAWTEGELVAGFGK